MSLAPWSPTSVRTRQSKKKGSTSAPYHQRQQWKRSFHLSRVDDKGNQPVVLEVKLPDRVTPRELRNSIRSQQCPSAAFHLSDGTDARTDEDELRRLSGPLKKRFAGLEEEQYSAATTSSISRCTDDVGVLFWQLAQASKPASSSFHNRLEPIACPAVF